MSRRSTLLAFTLAAACVAPGSADAAVSCTYDGVTHHATLVLTETGDFAKLSRAGDLLSLNNNGCAGARLDNTTAIEWHDFSPGGTWSELDLTGGPIGQGTNTIPMKVTAGDGTDRFSIIGTPQRDTIALGRGAIDDLVNVDFEQEPGAEDVDVRLGGVDIVQVGGNEGNDTIDGSGGHGTGVPLDKTLIADGGFGNDGLVGDAFSSTLTGGLGDDVLVGGSAETTMLPGEGDDFVLGGTAPDDVVDYSDAPAGVDVDLERSGFQDTGGSGADTISHVEGLVGSAFDDHLAGTEDNNGIQGRGGHDLVTGRGGDDILVGGVNPGDKTGNDIAGYADPSPGVNVGVTVSLLTTAFQQTGSEGKDQLLGISGLIGSPFDDTLTGDAGANRIDAGAGADTVDAGDGPDTVLLRDGIGDHADCGGAEDFVETDLAGLDVLNGCEHTAFAPTPVLPAAEQTGADSGQSAPGVADTTLTFRLTTKARQRLGNRGIVKASLSCPDEPCSTAVSSKLVVTRTARRAARATAFLSAGEARTVNLKLGVRNLRAARAALRRGARVSLKVTAVARDAAGNRRTMRRNVVLRA